jgi:hypothetical protein
VAVLRVCGHSSSWKEEFYRCPYGPMDKAPAYGAGDSGFESQYGLSFFFFLPGSTHRTQANTRRSANTQHTHIHTHTHTHTHTHNKTDCKKRLHPDARLAVRRSLLGKGGDARIELATSCTRSRNHTTRPITQLYVCKASNSKVRDVLELNQRPIGLQPIALPLS